MITGTIIRRSCERLPLSLTSMSSLPCDTSSLGVGLSKISLHFLKRLVVI